MASVIQEFLVKFGIQADDKAQTKFRKDQRNNRRSVQDLTSAFGSFGKYLKGFLAFTAAKQVVTFLANTAKSLSDLNYQSQRTKTSVGDLLALKNALATIGVNAETAGSNLESFANQYKNNQLQTATFLKTFGGIDKTGDINKDFLSLLQTLVRLRNEQQEGNIKAGQYREQLQTYFGISNELIEQYANNSFRFEKSLEEQAKKSKLYGEDLKKSAEAGTEFSVAISNLGASLSIFSKLYATPFIEILTGVVNILTKGIDEFTAFTKKIDAFNPYGIIDKLIKPEHQEYFKKKADIGYIFGFDKKPVKEENQLKSANDVYQYLLSQKVPAKVAAGITANAVGESGDLKTGSVNAQALNPNDKGRPAYGLFQLRDPALLADFQQRVGKHVKDASAQEQIGWFLNSPLTANARNLAALAPTSAEAASVITKKFERPANAEQKAAERGAFAEKLNPTVVNNVNITINGSGMDEKVLSYEMIKQMERSRLVQGAR